MACPVFFVSLAQEQVSASTDESSIDHSAMIQALRGDPFRLVPISFSVSDDLFMILIHKAGIEVRALT